MIIPHRKLWTSGQLTTAFRPGTTDVPSMGLGPPAKYAWVTGSTASVTSGAYATNAYGSETLDSDSYHDNVTNNSRFTANYPLRALVLCQMSDSTTGIITGMRIRKNATTAYHETWGPAYPSALNGGCGYGFALVDLVAGDYLESQSQHNSGTMTESPGMILVGINPGFASCYAYTTTGNSATSGTATVVNFDAEAVDSTGSMHDNVTNNSRITVPSTTNYLILYGGTAALSSSDTRVALLVNGATRIAGDAVLHDYTISGTKNGGFGWVVASLTAGDYVELQVTHNQGTSQTVTGGVAVIEIPSAMKMAVAKNSGADLTPGTGAFTTLTWNAESYDTDNMHDNSINTGRLSVKTAGTYLLLNKYEVSASAGSGIFDEINKNGSQISQAPAAGIISSGTGHSRVACMALSTSVIGDYFESVAYLQNSTTIYRDNSLFAAFRVDDWG